jgi:hypothetical protein
MKVAPRNTHGCLVFHLVYCLSVCSRCNLPSEPYVTVSRHTALPHLSPFAVSTVESVGHKTSQRFTTKRSQAPVGLSVLGGRPTVSDHS